MRLVRVGLGSIDTTVGAFRENTDRALALAHDMAADGVTHWNGVRNHQAANNLKAMRPGDRAFVSITACHRR